MDKNVSKSTMEKKLFIEAIGRYKEYLALSEYSTNTIKKYIGDIKLYLQFLESRELFDKHTVIEYKNFLMNQYKISSVNSYIISLNKYFTWMKYDSLKVKTNRVQRRTSLDRVISKNEYSKILEYLKSRQEIRDYLLIKTLAMTGIRIGELKFITYDAVLKGEAYAAFKGKTRTVYISDKLSKQLLDYCQENGVKEGVVFYGRNRKEGLEPSGIWKRMKRIARYAGVAERVVYPHSFRHFFAKNFMAKVGNIVELADLLGHSSIEMTRIYTLTSSQEKRRMLNCLDDEMCE